MIHITKRYSSVTALDDVTLVVRPGTIHALLGENGAGKTTLMRVAYGMTQPDRGSLHVHGQAVDLGSPSGALGAGIGMVHQHFTLVPSMTVAENLSLGGRGRLRYDAMRARVQSVATRTGFALDPDALIETLPVSAQQRVEIAKALARDASVLILDEPTAVLAPLETEDLLRWLRAYVQAGNTAVLITHKLREALAVADDVTVLRRGRTVYTGSAQEATPEQLTHLMMGATTFAQAPTVESHREDKNNSTTIFHAVAASVTGHDGRTSIRAAGFSIQGGDFIGIAAVEGAGQRELLRALAGRLNVSAGQLMRPKHVGFVPEDRHQDAVLLDRSLTENIALRGAGERRGRMDWRALRDRTQTLLTDFDVRALGPHVRLRDLSGGNQQKLVLARELALMSAESDPHALVVENPTRGLDVHAMKEIHIRLRDACARGAAVVMYSSDLDEVLALATRMFVVFSGTVREVPLDRIAIGQAMLGLS
ncbi:MAG: ATP-binding cassette domain-containing protein [bacterium]